mmetsp:Transcript_35386/g.56743  ORF Transcript_35386/g.56743 Transcript_35386/m.56743 type:complete len:289 (-) Transcript_35386:16-882(-)
MPQMRVFLIPVTKNCYALHVNTIFKCMSSATSSNVADHIDHDHYPPNHFSVKHIPILNKIKSERVRNIMQKQLTEMHEFWQECEQKSSSQPTSWKARLYMFAEHILQRIDGYEAFFAAIPYKVLLPAPHAHNKNDDAFTLSYVIPSGIDANLALNHLDIISRERIKYHRKWMWLNTSILPLTALLGLLPGPNVFVLYNGYRLWSHYKAYYGAIAVQHRRRQFEVIGDEFLGAMHTELESNAKMEIDDESLYQLQHTFDCKHVYHHLHRIRYQIVELGKHSTYALLSTS